MTNCLCTRFTENEFSDIVDENKSEQLSVILQECQTYGEIFEVLEALQGCMYKVAELSDYWKFELGR